MQRSPFDGNGAQPASHGGMKGMGGNNGRRRGVASAVFDADPDRIIGLLQRQYTSPHHLSPEHVVIGGVRRFFDPDEYFRPDFRGDIRLEAHPVPAVVDHPDLKVVAGQVILEHDSRREVAPRAFALLDIGSPNSLHTFLHHGFHISTSTDCAQLITIYFINDFRLS